MNCTISYRPQPDYQRCPRGRWQINKRHFRNFKSRTPALRAFCFSLNVTSSFSARITTIACEGAQFVGYYQASRQSAVERTKVASVQRSTGWRLTLEGMRPAHISAATLCLSNAQKNGIFISSKRMYLLPHPFVKRAILLLLPKDCPGTALYPPPKSLFIFFRKPAAPPPAAGFFLFSATFITVIYSKGIMPIGVTGVGAGAFGNGISEALFYRVLRHWL